MNMLPIIGLALSLAAPVPKEAPKKDNGPSIVGEWECVSLEAGGRIATAAEIKDIKFEFSADGKFKHNFDGASEGTYSVDSKKEPCEIDFVSAKNLKAKGAIYKLEKDSLTICAGDGPAARPTKFESPAGSRIMILTFKRVPKKE